MRAEVDSGILSAISRERCARRRRDRKKLIPVG